MSVSQSDIARYQTLMQQGNAAGALSHLQTLLQQNPHDRALLLNTAKLAQRLGDGNLTAACYQKLLNGPALKPVDYFNIGYALKTLGRFQAAIDAYQKSLDGGIDRPEEPYLNIGVIFADELHNEEKAIDAFNAARRHNPTLLAPYINLGNLYEETGQFDTAAATYHDAIQHIPQAYEAMARLANASTVTKPDDPILKQIAKAAEGSQPTDFDKECLNFALGTALDSMCEYERAWTHFTRANAHGRAYGQPYDADGMEAYIDIIIKCYSEDYFERQKQRESSSRSLSVQPVFICGMFRSGSTLTEQILGTHPDVTPLGELDFFAKHAGTVPGYYPAGTTSLTADNLIDLANQYRSQNAVKSALTPLITDKRPDNALYLGLIKSVFPTSKVIHTTREPIDNYLSIYFTQFGDGQSYARKLADIKHYHEQHTRLTEHWRRCFGNDIHDMHYDDCVAQPETTIKSALSFLGLNWTPDIFSFHQKKNRVKTASYKQVRRPLYGTSSGRAQNYQKFIPAFKA